MIHPSMMLSLMIATSHDAAWRHDARLPPAATRIVRIARAACGLSLSLRLSESLSFPLSLMARGAARTPVGSAGASGCGNNWAEGFFGGAGAGGGGGGGDDDHSAPLLARAADALRREAERSDGGVGTWVVFHSLAGGTGPSPLVRRHSSVVSRPSPLVRRHSSVVTRPSSLASSPLMMM